MSNAKFCQIVSLLHFDKNVAHIGGDSRDAAQTRMLIKDLVQLFSRDRWILARFSVLIHLQRTFQRTVCRGTFISLNQKPRLNYQFSWVAFEN